MVIYIHILFCVKKCDYCDFLSAPCDVATRERYVKSVVNELKCHSRKYGVTGRNMPVTSSMRGDGWKD